MKRPDKSLVLKRYSAARDALHALINSLTEAHLTRATDAAGWTVKDHLAHLAAWQNGVTALLQRKPRWAAMGLSPAEAASDDHDAYNAALQKRHLKLSAPAVLRMLADADRRFLRALQSLSTADLHKSYDHFARIHPIADARPVYGWVEGNSWHHINEHLSWMRQIVLDERARMIDLYGCGCDLLDAALAVTPQKMWQFRPSRKDWSVHEVLIHLADSETNSYLRARKALAEPGEAIMGYDQDKWANVLDYHARDTAEALAILRLVRKATHGLIAGLPATAWSTSYFHPESGKQVRLDDWLATYAVHIPGHIEQIQRTVTLWRKRQA